MYSKIIILGAMTWLFYIKNHIIVRGIIMRLKCMYSPTCPKQAAKGNTKMACLRLVRGGVLTLGEYPNHVNSSILPTKI